MIDVVEFHALQELCSAIYLGVLGQTSIREFDTGLHQQIGAEQQIDWNWHVRTAELSLILGRIPSLACCVGARGRK